MKRPIIKNAVGIIPHFAPDGFGLISASTIFIATIDNTIPRRKVKIAITPDGRITRPQIFNTENTI
jgi:hypothetical protein